ncbi:MAG TPA: hypothetical protein VH986_06745 [Acidimicrobiia bacterium]
MVEKTVRSIADAKADAAGLSRIALEYASTYDRVVPLAARSDFDEDAWAPLEQLIAVDEFERVGLQKEVMDWPAYRTALTGFARSGQWEGTFRRVTEAPGLVILELIEKLTKDGVVNEINTVSVFEFDEAGKIRHLDIYQQVAP